MNITKLEIMEVLKEDKAFADITTNSLIVQNKKQPFKIISKNVSPFILCGIDAVIQGFEASMAKYEIDFSLKDGNTVEHGADIICGTATIKELLQIERSILNIIQHLSGVATKTNMFVRALGNDKIKILDTRKTIPFMRKLQKYAVTIGGGQNHRMNLAEMVMIKDNHIAAVGGSVKEAVRLVKKNRPSLKVEVECDNLFQVEEAVKCPVDIIMLDNMTVQEIREASYIVRENCKAKIEISGGINLLNINDYSSLDIDYISVGALTHSVNAVDISMEVLM